MSLKEKLRYYWHETYYAVVSERGIEFAMSCKDVTERIDLGNMPTSFVDRLRFRLHLSLCQACLNYSNMSKALRRAVRELMKLGESPFNMEKLNQQLLKKFGRKG